MSSPSPDWNDLERLWQSTPAAAATNGIIRHQQRWRSWSLLFGLSEVVVAIAGIGFSIWVLTLARPYAPFPRRGALPEHSVLAGLDAATRRARVGTRLGLATFRVVAAGLVYFAAAAFLSVASPGLAAAAARRLLGVFGVWSASMAACQAFAIPSHVRRSRELARLEEIRRSLDA